MVVQPSTHRKGFPVNNSTLGRLLSAIPDLLDVVELLVLLLPHLTRVLAAVRRFRQDAVTPRRTCEFENELATIAREANQTIVAYEFNRIEPPCRDNCPMRLRFAGEEYRRRPKSPKRIGTLFGEIELRRYLYQAVEPGEHALFPLEKQLGIEAGLATPALAERVGLWSVEHEQEQVLSLLRREHNVPWSVQSLRKVTATLRDGLASFREEAQVQRVLDLLKRAFASKGKHRPVLAAGRDGIHVPIRKQGYHEGATATLSVFDRRGKRLGTVYLGQMPEAGQAILSEQLTALVTKVLTQWHAQGRPMPRLAYITDGGNHPKAYYQQVLRRMEDPWRAGQKLAWQWVLDFWHACGYVSDLAEALFGQGAKAARWFAKWRHWLRDRHQGVSQVVRSAMWHYNNNGRRLGKRKEEEYWKAYRYLRKHSVWMKYPDYRRQGMPIGSGVTEAACKTVFAERLKRSGMTWGHPGGQVILDLRVLVLSKVWHDVHKTYLHSRPQPTVAKPASQPVSHGRVLNKAA
jgi:hypothetical protein